MTWASWTPEEIRQRREDAGLSKEEFARAVKVDVRTVYRWESGVTKPNSRDQIVIQQALEMARSIAVAVRSDKASKLSK